MRFAEIAQGFPVFITGEEQTVLEKIQSAQYIMKRNLSEREQVIANSLVTKSVIQRKKQDGKIFYKAPSSEFPTNTGSHIT